MNDELPNESQPDQSNSTELQSPPLHLNRVHPPQKSNLRDHPNIMHPALPKTAALPLSWRSCPVSSAS